MSEAAGAEKRRRGVSGWKAFFLVVSSGTAAAFLVVGVIFGALRLFSSAINVNPQERDFAAAAPTRGVVSSLAPGGFDLCDSLGNIQAFSAAMPQRVDSGERYSDTALENPEEEARVIENECSWVLNIGGLEQSLFTLSYRSIAAVPSGESATEKASLEFERERSEVGEGFLSVVSEGDIGGLEGGGYYVYGDVRDEEVVQAMHFVGLVKSSVFEISIEGESSSGGGGDLEEEYRSLIRQMMPDIQMRFDRIIPD
ncbi:hypothetical protein SAMN02745673_04114 [Marinactinospora thermotolerans DSM 45154]|uniref:Uncharacterized protein n=1 Tax=Marinactinospora thermotolerans DSM 45154 TaxID=1122192 RepID=A0A1T4SXY9_9ACTN|nr:hypothetical protein [Marinactinospora thermotolerans]SKA32979.1 hypothetical protein SAMN02745673_04114 [Marinactinospora thermotolerans DSM 45154]